MNDEWFDSNDHPPTIARIEANPFQRKSGVFTKTDATLWTRFWSWLFPRLNAGADLAQEYAQGEIAGRDAQARKTAEEAAEIAAKREVLEAQVAVSRQVEVKHFIDNVHAIEQLDTRAGKAVAFAKLLESNPKVATQLEIINDLLARLQLQNGLALSPAPDKKASTRKRTSRKKSAKKGPLSNPESNPLSDPDSKLV